MTRTYDVPHSGNITRVELENGIVVLAYEATHVRSVVMQGVIRAGSLYNTTRRLGLASLTASALMYGTDKHDFDALHRTLEDIGADFGYSGGVHYTHFSGKALAGDLPVLLAVLRETLLTPAFPDAMVQNLIRQRLTELQYAEQDSRYRARRAFQTGLYPPEHPYHHSNYGTTESLPTLTPADLRSFHASVYGAQGMVVTVVGAVKPADAVQMVRDALGDWHNPSQPPPQSIANIAPPITTQHLRTVIAGKTQTDIVLGTLSPLRRDPDYIPATIANSILGEFGMMGRLGAIIREELGLAYYAHSQVEGGEAQGAWSISAGVAPDNVPLAIEKALEQVRRLRDELVSEADLADNQAYFTGRLPLRLESCAGIANMLEAMERYSLGLDYLANYHDMIYSITVDMLQGVVRRYLNPEAMIISTAGAG